MVKLKLAVSIAAVYLGSSTVSVTVIIVVKYRAYLPVSQLIIGVQYNYLVSGLQVYRYNSY